MTAAVTLTEDDLMEAVRHFLGARGWNATRVEIDPDGRYPVVVRADVEIPDPNLAAAPPPPDDEPDPTPAQTAVWPPLRPRPHLKIVA